MANDTIHVTHGYDSPLYVSYKTISPDAPRDLTGWQLEAWIEYRCKKLIILDVEVLDLVQGQHRIILLADQISKILPAKGCELTLMYTSPLALKSVVRVNIIVDR
jgi:hypothetical protein